LVGCSDNGVQPVSVTQNTYPTLATIEGGGARDVGCGGGDALDNRVYVISTETYPGTTDQYKMYRGAPDHSVGMGGICTWQWLCGQGTTICGAGTNNGCFAINTPACQVLKFNGDPNPQPGGHYWDEYY
jgi:hypothetical protein